MKAIISKSKQSDKGFFTNTIKFETEQTSNYLGSQGLLIQDTYFYKTEKSELVVKGKPVESVELPNFDPEFFNIRVSHYEIENVDESTGVVTKIPATAKWLDGQKSQEQIEAIIAKRNVAQTEQA